MKTLKDAIKIIMAEPPELHYPAYYADLLRTKGSEIPNSSETIYRQAAIDAINCDITITGKQNAEVVAETIASFVDRIKALPPSEPERKTGAWIDYSKDGFVECPFCHSATNCDGNRDELHYCFSCGAELR